MAIDITCKNCGGELRFDATSEELKCCKCASIVDIPEQNTILNRKQLNEKSTIKESKTKYAQYHCSTCGRNHIVSTNSELITCPSCGDANLTRTINVEYMPDGIIPFKLDKENALKCFKDWLKKRRFTPNKFKKNVTNFNFTGVYQPAYLYNFYCKSDFSGIGVKQTTTYRYNSTTKQSTPVTHYHREHFSGNREDHYRDYLDSANKNISTEVLKKIGNYNYQNIYVYRPEFLYGWIGSEVDIPLETSVQRTKNTILYDIKNKAQNQNYYDRVENFVCNTNFVKSEFNYLYLPIWDCNYKYKNETYNFYINGATGNIYGKAPKSKAKITALTLFILGIVGVLTFLFIKYLL